MESSNTEEGITPVPNGLGPLASFQDTHIQSRIRSTAKAVDIARQLASFPAEEQLEIMKQIHHILGIDFHLLRED